MVYATSFVLFPLGASCIVTGCENWGAHLMSSRLLQCKIRRCCWCLQGWFPWCTGDSFPQHWLNVPAWSSHPKQLPRTLKLSKKVSFQDVSISELSVRVMCAMAWLFGFGSLMKVITYLKVYIRKGARSGLNVGAVHSERGLWIFSSSASVIFFVKPNTL